ncbi:hypothetical protein FOZ62_022060, partial [Perkinsus olseni]
PFEYRSRAVPLREKKKKVPLEKGLITPHGTDAPEDGRAAKSAVPPPPPPPPPKTAVAHKSCLLLMAALRHPFGHAKLFFFTFLLLAALALEQEPELPTGIDFGSYSLKIATVGEHGADLVVNSLSERSTATAVSFAHD